jgi:hypothetical protein
VTSTAKCITILAGSSENEWSTWKVCWRNQMPEQCKLEIWWHEVTPANIFSFDNGAKYNNEGNGGEDTNDSQDPQLLINPVSKTYWKKREFQQNGVVQPIEYFCTHKTLNFGFPSYRKGRRRGVELQGLLTEVEVRYRDDIKWNPPCESSQQTMMVCCWLVFTSHSHWEPLASRYLGGRAPTKCWLGMNPTINYHSFWLDQRVMGPAITI